MNMNKKYWNCQLLRAFWNTWIALCFKWDKGIHKIPFKNAFLKTNYQCGFLGMLMWVQFKFENHRDKGEWREICKRLKPYDRCVVIYSSLSSGSCYTNILKRTFKNTIHRPQLTNFFMISIAGVSSEMFWPKLRHSVNHSEAVNTLLTWPVRFLLFPSHLFSLAYTFTKTKKVAWPSFLS